MTDERSAKQRPGPFMIHCTVSLMIADLNRSDCVAPFPMRRETTKINHAQKG
jgi:hypothetical protein